MTVDYQSYLASREWALKREAVRERSGNKCEHCLSGPQQAVHHLTYERVGCEELRDLMAVCNPCHEWFSGKSNLNPAIQWLVISVVADGLHVLIPFDVPDSWRDDDLKWIPTAKRRCYGTGCVWCAEADPYWPTFAGQLWWRVP